MATISEEGSAACETEIQFKQGITDGTYKLLELSAELLAAISSSRFNAAAGVAENMVELRGNERDEAALCTRDKTYVVRLVESSNTHLLVRADPDSIFTTSTDSDKSHELSDDNPSPYKKAKITPSDGTAAPPSPSPSSPAIRYVEGMVGQHYECIETRPRLYALREMLSRKLYTVEEAEEEENRAAEAQRRMEAGYMEMMNEEEEMMQHPSHPIVTQSSSSSSTHPTHPTLFTTSMLRRLIQSSDAQLFSALRSLDAIEDHSGHWRVLHPSSVESVLESILTFFIERGWKETEAVSAEEIAIALREIYPMRITKHVLRMHAHKEEEGGEEEEDDVVTLDPSKVCLFRAVQLFAQKDPYPAAAFMNAWQSSVPECMRVDASMLRGHAILETSAALEAAAARTASVSGGSGGGVQRSSSTSPTAAQQWRYLPLSSLSPLVKTRLAQLFAVRSKWSLAELEPYLDEVREPAQTMEQLLLKYARPITTTDKAGVKSIVYTKR